MACLRKEVRKAFLLIMAITIGSNIWSSGGAALQQTDVSFNQSMGLINIPTADFLRHRDYKVSLGAAIFSVGIFNYYELGLLAFSNNDVLYVGNRLAIKLVDEEGAFPAIAVGAEGAVEMNQISGDQEFRSYYVVASKSLGDFGRLHAGIGSGRFLGEGERSEGLHGVFMGIGKSFFEEKLNQITVKLEEDGRNINFGIEYRILYGLNMVLTMAKLDNWIFSHPAPNNSVDVLVGFIWDGTLPR